MPGRTLRGLCCDDEPAACRAVEAILDRCGFEVVAPVASAGEAVAAAAAARPDALVIDLALTGDPGLRTLALVRAAAPGCAVIVVSSLDTMGPAARDAGAYDFVAKSDLRALETCLRRLVGEVQGAAVARGPSAAGLSGSRSTKAPVS